MWVEERGARLSYPDSTMHAVRSASASGPLPFCSPCAWVDGDHALLSDPDRVDQSSARAEPRRSRAAKRRRSVASSVCRSHSRAGSESSAPSARNSRPGTCPDDGRIRMPSSGRTSGKQRGFSGPGSPQRQDQAIHLLGRGLLSQASHQAWPRQHEDRHPLAAATRAPGNAFPAAPGTVGVNPLASA